MTVEQLCRDLLQQAWNDDLVDGVRIKDDLTTESLFGMAQLVVEFMQQEGFEVESPCMSLSNEAVPMSRTYYVSPHSVAVA